MRFKIFGQPPSLWKKKIGPAGNFDGSWSIKHFLVTLPPFKVTSKERRKEEKQGDLIDQKIIESFFDSLWKVRRRLESGWKWSWNLNCEPTHEAKAQRARKHNSVSLRVLQISTTRWLASTEFPTRRSSFPTTTTTSSTSSRRRWRHLEFFTKTGWQLNSFWPQRTTLILACYLHRQQSQ